MTANIPHPRETRIFTIVQAIRDLFDGQTNATGEVTLTPGATITAVQNANCGERSRIFLSPETANAAAALPSTFISEVGRGSFAISHAASALTDRRFSYVCLSN